MGLVAAGFLDQRITIQTLTVVRGALGGHDETWSPLATVWAQMMDMTGREIFQAKAMGSAATVLITIRYRSDVRASQRILFTDGSIAPDRVDPACHAQGTTGTLLLEAR
jgi:SPP1 family predicted phage head-tail adaptor